ncbi:hypothetical protein RRG08_005818, partial [Elysia crispata]
GRPQSRRCATLFRDVKSRGAVDQTLHVVWRALVASSRAFTGQGPT